MIAISVIAIAEEEEEEEEESLYIDPHSLGLEGVVLRGFGIKPKAQKCFGINRNRTDNGFVL